MRVRVYSRSLLIKNTIIFVFLSYLFLFFIENFNNPRIFSDFNLLKIHSNKNFALGLVTIALAVNIFFISAWSRFLFLAFSIYIFINAIKIYYLKTTPAILPLSLVYMMCSYYFYSLFSEEIKGAAYVPNFGKSDLNPVRHRNLTAKLIFRDVGYKASLLNWDEENAFFYLNNEQKLRGKLKIELFLNKTKFFFEGNVVTSYNKGYGIRILRNSNNNDLCWSDLYKVLLDRGY